MHFASMHASTEHEHVNLFDHDASDAATSISVAEAHMLSKLSGAVRYQSSTICWTLRRSNTIVRPAHALHIEDCVVTSEKNKALCAGLAFDYVLGLTLFIFTSLP